MGPNKNLMGVDLAAPLPKIANQFLATLQLRARRLVAIEISHQTNAKGDVVQVIAVDMAPVDLPSPAIAHFDLPVAGRCAIANNEMIGKSVLHPTDVSVVIVEHARIALPRAAVVDHDELPASPLHGCAS
jgi:hypothetical protein